MRGFRVLAVTLVVLGQLVAVPAVSAIGTYAAGWSVTMPSGQPRTDGSIKVGDELDVWVKKPSGTTITACSFQVATRGDMMTSPGVAREDGTCGFKLVVPRTNSRETGDPVSDDVCVLFDHPSFLDGVMRELRGADRAQPNGRDCSRRWGDPQVLDFAFDGSGTARTFSSTPQVLSWNIADWDPSYKALRFNKTWQLAFPAFVSWCEGPYLNGSWLTTFQMRNPAGDCPNWSLRLPGVLPETLPWSGGPGAWDVEIIMDYKTAAMPDGARTIASQVVPYEPSDGIYESSFASIAPTSLARARFATVGENWRPTYQVTGDGATECALGIGNGDPFVAPVSGDGTCTFDIPAFEDPGDTMQYGVSARFVNGATFYASYGGTVSAIDPPTQPGIPPPAANDDGATTVEAQPGSGQGMAIEMEVAPATSTAQTADRELAAAPLAAGDCRGVKYATNFQAVTGLTKVRRKCALPPGDYVITARMVDAAGKVKVRRRTFSIVPTDGAGTLRAAPQSASAGARGQTLSFTYTLGYGGMVKGALRLTVPDGWSPPSTDPAAPGYARASKGRLTVSGRTIVVGGLSGSGGQTIVITYGAKSGGGPGATAPVATGAHAWSVLQKGSVGGTFKSLGTTPKVTIYAADGSGAMTASKTSFKSGAKGKTIVFSYTAAAGGMKAGELRLAVPDGWSAPAVTGSRPGYVTASAGNLRLDGRTIVVSGVTLRRGQTLTITYGSKAAGGPGASAPATRSAQTWLSRQKSTPTGRLTRLDRSPRITIE